MTERAQEDAYFYRINQELIERMHEQDFDVPSHDQNSNQNAGTIFEILNQQLQPDENWFVDVCF